VAADVPKAELDRLYTAPLDRFVAERDQLSRRLKKEGKAEAAADVKGLSKPSVPAWAVNQLARSRGADVRKLLAAADRLRKAQTSGAGPDAFRKATEEEREIVAQLVDAAAELLRDAGRPAGDAVLGRIRSTLHAAVADDDARQLLEQGRLERDLEPTGFDALAGLTISAARPASAKQQTRASELDRRRVKRAEAELGEARDRAKELRRAASEAEREWKRVAKEAERADAAVERAKAKLEDARG
jgi:hypothetical protein